MTKLKQRASKLAYALSTLVLVAPTGTVYAASNPGTPIAAVARNPNQLDLFITGNDGVVSTSWWTAGSDWSGLKGWRPIGGFFPADARVSAVSRNPNQLDLFVVGNNGVVYTSWWTAGSDWSGINNNWRAIGGFFPPGSPVAVVSRNPNQLDLFVVGYNGVVYTSWWTAGSDWSGINNNWRAIGGFFPPSSAVAAVSRNPNQLDLFLVGYNGVVYTSWWTAGSDWSGINNDWRAIGGFFTPGAPVAAVSRNPNQLDLFVTGNNGVVYTSWWTAGSDWSGINNNWRAIGGFFPPGAPVAAVSRNPGQLDLFITGYAGIVYTSWWTAGSDWSGINNNWRPISPAPQLTANPQSNQIGYGLSFSGTNFPSGTYDMYLDGFVTLKGPLGVGPVTANASGSLSGYYQFTCSSFRPSTVNLEAKDRLTNAVVASTSVYFHCSY